MKFERMPQVYIHFSVMLLHRAPAHLFSDRNTMGLVSSIIPRVVHTAHTIKLGFLDNASIANS